jgi:hypothetical protein
MRAQLLSVLVLIALSAAPRAQDVDGQLNLGDTFTGVVSEADEVDVALFDALQGTEITITGKPAKGSDLVLHVQVVDPGTDEVLAEMSDEKSVKLELVSPLTATLELRVSGDGGSTGGFSIQTKAKLQKAAFSPASEPGSGSPGSAHVDFDALAGTQLNLTVQPAKGSGAEVGPLVLVGPAGPVDLAPFTTVKNGKVTVKKALLPDFGPYTLDVDNVGDPGDLVVKLTLKAAKPKKRTVIESHFTLALDPSIPLNGTTSSKSLKLLGLVHDLGGGTLPDSVEWTRGGAGGSIKVKKGAFSGAVPLAEGDNEIELFANGLPAGLVVQVTCNPGYDFGGRLQLKPDVMYVSESKQLVAKIALTDKKTKGDQVRLVREDAGGDEIEVLTLVDTGDLGFGDDIEGDGVFSGKANLALPEAQTARFRVVVGKKGGGPARSERVEVLVTQHLTNGELTEILDEHASMEAQIESAIAGGTLPEKLDELLAALQADPDVAQAGKGASGKGLWVVYENGIAGVLYTPTADQKGGGMEGGALPQAALPPVGDPWRARLEQAAQAQREIHGPPGTSLDYTGWYVAPPAEPKLPPGALAAAPPNRVQSSRARIIAAQFFDWGNNDDIPEMNQMLQDDGCFDVSYTTYGSSGSGSVEDFKSLGNYGIVLVSSHGDSFYDGLLTLWKDTFKWNGPFGEVVVHSNMNATTANKVTYEDDLKTGRLVLWYGQYGMTPSFFRKYTGTMPNSLVYMSICRGTWNGTLAQAFLDQGAGAFLGYSDYVDVGFTIQCGVPFLEKMLEDGTTIDDAFIPGLKETDGDPAEFMLFGATSLELDPGNLHDGDFEAGTLQQSWVTQGDARALPVLGNFVPTEGLWMGIVSTGLGFTVDSGRMSQTFCLSGDAKKISFRWNFISEEFVEYCGDIYQDFFRVSIANLDEGGSAVLFYTAIDDVCGNVSPVGFSFDQGDAHATGWRSTTVPIPASFAGKKVRLTIEAGDVGDSIYDTAVLVDDVKVID